jgi:hypothetical protein
MCASCGLIRINLDGDFAALFPGHALDGGKRLGAGRIEQANASRNDGLEKTSYPTPTGPRQRR